MLDKNLLFVTLPLLLVSGLALVKGIARLIAASRVDELAKLPLASGGTVDIREAGEVVLSLRGKIGSTAFAGASFALHDAAGKAVPSRMIVARSLRSGLDGETTLAVRRFAIPAPGRHRLQASGFDPERIDGNNRLVLARPGGTPLILSVLWVVTAAIALLASLVFSAFSAFAQPAAAGVSVPAVGSPARTAILDAVRSELRLASDGGSRFKVFHLKTAGAWAYFEGNEIVHVAGREWQETDLTVKALLREEDGRWRVRALWSLPGNERLPLRQFERRIGDLRARWQLPAGLLP
ncbi:hypothetical protein [Accumulibacter sp.]|uniref:hypothetical protein n=1 Tax=Accumulibacter sp. TaxID=2053492 RepID=UPI001AC8F325|nr:hypothetical protein [Accumulibacter sp.]MBN8454762.1 hypothetical protein [Accumulibacter sp.]MBO3707302.1 hypothetical protein [Candidatus Accumulibacter conexus]